MVRMFSRRGRGLLPELLVIEFSVAILDDPHSRRHPETMMFAAGAGVRGVERFFANVGSLRSCNPYAAFAAVHESGPGHRPPVRGGAIFPSAGRGDKRTMSGRRSNGALDPMY